MTMQVGDVVTARFPDGRGAEKAKRRPAVVVRVGGPTVLVAPMTDARRKSYPTHAAIADYPSGSQTKNAVVACEHAWSMAPERLSVRAGARPLTATERSRVRMALSITLGLFPVGRPPSAPDPARGSWVPLEFGEQPDVEASGRRLGLVISNDVGNFFGPTLMVVPLMGDEAAHHGVDVPEGRLDLGRLRVADRVRLTPGAAPPPIRPAALQTVDAALRDYVLAPLEAN